MVEGEDGLIRFVGREDEMIKTAGNRLSPQEIEEAVLSGGEVQEAVAIGVPDDRLGQTIAVVLAGDPGQEAVLRTRLRRDLPSFMQPGRYVWRDALPRNANGKLDRAALAAEVRLDPSQSGEGGPERGAPEPGVELTSPPCDVASPPRGRTA